MLLSEVFAKVLVITNQKEYHRVMGAKAELIGCDFEFIDGVFIEHPDLLSAKVIGNRQAHLNAIKLAKEKGWQNVLVFEDDLLIDRPLMTEVLPKIKPIVDRCDWAVFYLGGRHRLIPKDIGILGVVKPTSVIGTHAIAYEHYYYDKLIEHLDRPDSDLTPVDYCFAGYPGTEETNFLNTHNCYCAYPRFVYQKDGYSMGADKFILSSYWKENIQAVYCK